MGNNNQQTFRQVALAMLRRMHDQAAADESRDGAHASSARHEQLAAKYRNAANQEGEVTAMTTTRSAYGADLAADTVLFAYDCGCEFGVLHVLLIERGWDPCWALPGGYVESGERFEQAARRELGEETGLLAPARLDLVGVYDKPDRDPRGRVVSVAYLGLLTRPVPARAADDATAARWVPVEQVLNGDEPVAFDHAEIITAAYAHLQRTGWWTS